MSNGPFIPYHFDDLVIPLSSRSWVVAGSTVLEPDGDDAFPGPVEISCISRLDDEGFLDYEDMPLSCFTPEEQLELIEKITASFDRDHLNQYFAEHVDDYR